MTQSRLTRPLIAILVAIAVSCILLSQGRGGAGAGGGGGQRGGAAPAAQRGQGGQAGARGAGTARGAAGANRGARGERRGQEQQKKEELEPDNGLVTAYVTVVGKDHNAIPGLTRSNFQVLEDGVEQKIEAFSVEGGSTTVGFIVGGDPTDFKGKTNTSSLSMMGIRRAAP